MTRTWTRGDSGFVAVCVALTLTSGIVAWRDFGHAFPEARIEFQVNRQESRQLAADFVGRLGHELASCKHAAIFLYDNEQKVFLERTLGSNEATAFFDDEIKLWRWSHRWFRPHEKEEFRVEVTPRGRIALFERLLPEDAAGDSLPEAAARQVAESFVAAHTDAVLERYQFVEASAIRRPARIDHTFTWKRAGIDVQGASVRLRVEVAGNAVTSYEEFLQVPDQWLHDYDRLRARNETANGVATVLGLLTGLAMLVVLVLRIRDHDVRWRTATAFGAVAFVLQLLAALNELGLARYDYPTEQGYLGYMIWQVVVGILGASAAGGLVLVLTAASEPVYRLQYPDKLSLARSFSWRGIGSRDAFRQIVLGIALAFFFVAYQTVFYLVAARFGAWAPLDVPYDNMLNTVLPWATVLVAGFFPAVSEEFTSRMFSVPFLSRFLRSRYIGTRAAVTLAIVASSFIWGFGHAAYPNQPFYIRGVEVGLVGVLTAWVMVRWGILATLVWHYSVDACYTALLMLRSGDSYLKISGAAAAGILLVPLGLALWRVLRNGGFEPTAGLRNADEPGPQPLAAPVAAEPANEAVVIQPLPRRRLLVGALAAAALLALCLVPVERPGDGIEVRLGREAARAAGIAQARAAGSDPDSFRVAVGMLSLYDEEDGKYVLEHGGITALNAAYRAALRTPVWLVRLYRPEALEEWNLLLPVDAGPTPTLVGFEHAVPEHAAGDRSSAEAARQVAEAFVRAQGLPVDAWDLVETSTAERAARIDHTFEWEDSRAFHGEAHPRTTVTVQGGRIGSLDTWLHVPEEWSRAARERPLVQLFAWVLSRTLLGAVLFLVVLLFVGEVRAGRFPWRRALQWGGVAGAGALLTFVLEWETRVALSYPTATPWSLFRILAWSMAGVRVVVFGTVTAMLVGTLLALRPQTRAFLAGPGVTSRRAALGLVLIGAATLLGLRQALDLVQAAFPAHVQVGELFTLEAAALPLPWLHETASMLTTGLMALPLLGLVAHLGSVTLGWRRFFVVVAAGVVLYAVGRTHDPVAWVVGTLQLTLLVGGLLWLTGFLCRGHDIAYVLTFVTAWGARACVTWWRQPEPSLGAAAWILAALVGAGIVLLLRRARRDPAADSGPG